MLKGTLHLSIWFSCLSFKFFFNVLKNDQEKEWISFVFTWDWTGCRVCAGAFYKCAGSVQFVRSNFALRERRKTICVRTAHSITSRQHQNNSGSKKQQLLGILNFIWLYFLFVRLTGIRMICIRMRDVQFVVFSCPASTCIWLAIARRSRQNRFYRPNSACTLT